MLNSVSITPHPKLPPTEAVARQRPTTRLAAEARRRQLIGIGLSKLVEKPIQDLAIDEVAAEAGISRGLLFHYFATKREFYLACVAAAGRRILRNTAADPELSPTDQLRAMVGLFVEQIDRRRDFYLSLVHGTGGGDVDVVAVYESIRDKMTNRVLAALSLDAPAHLDASAHNVVHAWWAYVEDQAIEWSGQSGDRRTRSVDDLIDHNVAALTALLDLR